MSDRGLESRARAVSRTRLDENSAIAFVAPVSAPADIRSLRAALELVNHAACSVEIEKIREGGRTVADLARPIDGGV